MNTGEWTPAAEARRGRREGFEESATINVAFGRWTTLAKQDLWIRVVLLAASTCNALGHSEWLPGELAEALGLDGDADARALRRGIKRAKEAGWLDGRSSVRCLVLDDRAIQPGPERSGGTCHHHRIGDPSRTHPPAPLREREAEQRRRREQRSARRAGREAELDLSSAVWTR